MPLTLAPPLRVSTTPLSAKSWLSESEDRTFLSRTRTRFNPERFVPDNEPRDPRDWLRIHDQGTLRAGCGMALATCCEVVHWLKTGRVVRLSGSFGYLVAQKLSGRLGRDAGATICGTVKAGKVFGVCREKIVPTTSVYRDTFSVRARRNGRRYRIASHSMLGNHRDVHHFLAARLGAVLLACPWSESLASAGEIIEEDAGRSLGSHVVAIVGVANEMRDECGRPYLIAANSHGRRWGNEGFALIAPHLFDNWGNRRDALLVGLSDMDTYQRRSTKHE